MTAKRFLSTFILGLFYLFLLCVHAEAQQLATFVSGTGHDMNSNGTNNTCTRNTPCQTLAYAISQTVNGGKVYVLDALNEDRRFSPLSISQSVSIIGAGARAGIDGSINVTPETGGRVLLKGLDVHGLLVQGEGITVIVDDCTITDGSFGISFTPIGTASSNLNVRNSIVARNSGTGVSIQPQSTGKALAVIENVNINNNSYGVRAFDNSTVTIRNSVISESIFGGVRSEAVVGGQVSVFIEHSQVSHNGGSGVVASGTTAVLLISDVTITNNAGSGVSYTSGGTVLSYKNNAINGPTMAPTTTTLN
ncbi:MAG: right-handed parallel beta-helix repeat-containing protein [Thermoanaerobaculia bacterium]